MELIIILLPVVLIMIGIEEIKYKLKIRRDAIYYRDLNRKIELMEQKEREEMLQHKTKGNNQREKILVDIAIIAIIIFVFYIILK